jgi:hypothetical protein
MTVTITLSELGMIVFLAVALAAVAARAIAETLADEGAAVALAATDAAAISRIAVAFIASKLGVEPGEVTRYHAATREATDPNSGEE